MNHPANTLPKFTFSLRTRDGQAVENIVISARSREEAERRLRQMYLNCEISHCEELHPENLSGEEMSFEDIMTLISK